MTTTSDDLEHAARRNPDNPDLLLSRNVLRILEQRGMTRLDLIAAMGPGTHRTTIYPKLQGRIGWKVMELVAVAGALGVQPAELLEDRPTS